MDYIDEQFLLFLGIKEVDDQKIWMQKYLGWINIANRPITQKAIARHILKIAPLYR